jgi:hypothetical protein
MQMYRRLNMVAFGRRGSACLKTPFIVALLPLKVQTETGMHSWHDLPFIQIKRPSSRLVPTYLKHLDPLMFATFFRYGDHVGSNVLKYLDIRAAALDPARIFRKRGSYRARRAKRLPAFFRSRLNGREG